MLAWRICERGYALDRSGQGPARQGARWNRPGVPAVYASSTVDLAQREAAQSESGEADDQVLVRITTPDDAVLLRRFSPKELPAGWDADPPSSEAVEFGNRLLESNEVLMLLMPSAVLPEAHNVILNPRHPAYDSVEFAIDDSQQAHGSTKSKESHDEDVLDAAVSMTFPASDPIAPQNPAR